MQMYTLFYNLFITLPYKAFLIGLGLFGIGFLIGFHELGHYLFCKLFNIRTPSFSIGFGPRLWTRKIGDTVFALSAIPLGGYVEIAGAAEVGQGEQAEAHSADEQSFSSKPYWQKMLVMGGGILCNLLFAYAAISIVFMMGLPKTEILYPVNAVTTIETVIKDSAAERFGLLAGDKIVSFNNQQLHHNAQKLIELLSDKAHQQVILEIERQGGLQEISIVLDERSNMGTPTGSLGVKFLSTETEGLPLFQAIKQGFTQTNALIGATFRAFKYIFVKKDVSQMAGPVMLISATVSGAGKGLRIFLLFLAIISINLAVLNLIPLPILDGGQALFYTIEAIIGRPMPIKIKEYIHIVSWLLILTLTIYLTYKDILRIVAPYSSALARMFGF